MIQNANQQKKKVTFNDGYQPKQGTLNTSNPPQGGSGVPSKSPDKSKK